MAEEKMFENRIKGLLTQKGAWFVKYWGGGSFTRSGIPDILACVNGSFIGIELKSSRGIPSALQLRSLRDIDKAGGYAILLYPDMEVTFKRFINSMTPTNYTMTEKLYEDLSGRWKKYEKERWKAYE